MTTKAELIEQARDAGIDVDSSMTKAELEEKLADVNTAVVGAPDKSERHDGQPVGDVPSVATSADQPVADHHHEDGLGPELTPAGAHRHGPGEPEHNHPVPEVPGGPDHVVPAPASDEDVKGSGKAPKAQSWIVDRDCTAVVNGQLLELKAGQTVSGEVGAYLANTGAPVTAK